MPNILKVTKDEITWQLSGSSINSGPQANARIKEYLGEDAKFFAPMSATTTGYTWTSPETGWKPLASANDVQRSTVASELASLRRRVQEKLSSRQKLAGEILSLPSDDGKYIFFIEGNDGIRILIAGWGFSNARRKVVILPNNKTESASILTAKIGFTINNELQSSHKFYITTLGGSSKECLTDAEGFYHLGEQKIGTNVNLIDADSQKSISFVIDKGKTDYIFDVTRNSNVRIKITSDEESLDNTEISVEYHGAINKYTTDSLGEVNISVPYFKHEILNVKIEDVEKNIICQFPETRVDINLPKPQDIIIQPPVDNLSNVTVRCIAQNGNPRCGYPLVIEIEGNKSDFLTDKDGIVKLSPQKKGTNIKIVDGFCDNISLSRIANETNLVIEFIVEEKVPEMPDNILQMIGIDGKPLSNQKVILRQGDKSLILDLDNEGFTKFKVTEFQCGKEMSAQILSNEEEFDQIPFTLDEDEHNYVIEETIATKKAWLNKLLNIIIAIILIAGIAELGTIFVHHLL